MADVFGGYTPTSRKVWDHVGNIFPNVEHSEGVRPALGAHPAAWLPVQFKDKYFEEWVVITPGKIVALDNNGDLVPAGLKTATSISYTSSDVSAGTIDVTTGEPVTSEKTVTLANVDGSTSSFLGDIGTALNISYPVGVAPYAYWQWAGGDGMNPAEYKQHNFNLQHAASLLCDYNLRLPLVPATAASEDLSGTTLTNTAITFGIKALKSRTGIRATARYDGSSGVYPVASTDTVVAIVLDNYPVAKNTSRTPIKLHADTTTSAAISGVLVNEKSSPSSVKASGDFFVDYDFGVLFVYSSDGNSLPSTLGTTQGAVTYSHYAAAPASVSKFACVVGNPKPGDFLTFDDNSNFQVATPSVASASAAAAWVYGLVGQVQKLDSDHPKHYLDYVKTAYASIGTDATGALPGSSGQMDQNPGTANGGYPSELHFAGGADTMVVVNLILR